jgi:hypothetical protein
MSTHEWAANQLRNAAVDQVTATAVLSLMEVWETKTFWGDSERADRVLQLFTDLARGHAIEPESGPERKWVASTSAKPRQHDVVRVRLDAFRDEEKHELNGREGTIARVSRGTLVVAFEDGSVMHTAPENLETLVPLDRKS